MDPRKSKDLRHRQRSRCLELLNWVYIVDIDSLDVNDSYEVPREETRLPVTLEEQKNYLGYQLQNRGRRNPVSNLTTILLRLSSESKHHMVFLFVELSEIDLCLRQDQVLTVLSRTCSFLQHVLNERLDTDERLSPILREAYLADEITEDELRLSQFIRLCRNDVSHNFWYDTEWSYAVHQHAALCAVTLLLSLLDSWYGVDWYVEERLSISKCIRVVEGEFRFEWDIENHTYNKNSIYEKYDRSMNLATQADILYDNQ